MTADLHSITTTVNGKHYKRRVESRLLLSDFIRHDLGLTGTHVGCEHGVCGACTVLYDGLPVRSCLMLAAQANGHEINTVEALATDRDRLHPLQKAFRAAHGLQCGYCTPGILMTMTAFLKRTRHRTSARFAKRSRAIYAAARDISTSWTRCCSRLRDHPRRKNRSQRTQRAQRKASKSSRHETLFILCVLSVTCFCV